MGIVKILEEIFKAPKKEKAEEKEVKQEVREIKPAARGVFTFSLTAVVPPSSMLLRTENYREFSERIKIRKISIYFPPGCQNLVKLLIGIGNRYITEDWVESADDKRLEIVPREEIVEPRTRVWAEIINGDLQNQHKVSIDIEAEYI